MGSSAIGLVRGSTIELEGGLPGLDGQRVRIVAEPVDEAVLRAIAEATADDTPLSDQERAGAAEVRAGTAKTLSTEEMRARILENQRRSG